MYPLTHLIDNINCLLLYKKLLYKLSDLKQHTFNVLYFYGSEILSWLAESSSLDSGMRPLS